MRDGTVPDGWRRVPLGSVVAVRTEKVEPRDVAGVPYVALGHLEQGGLRLLTWQTAETAVSTKTLFMKGDVLFGKLRPNLRKAALAPFDGICSTDILPLFARDGLEPGFLAQLCQWPPLQEHAVSTAEGTKMPRTSWRALRQFSLLLPPLSEQRKIAEILSSVDDAIERTEAVIEQVRRVKQGLAQQLLTRGLPGRHTHFKQTEVGEIPACWEVVRLGEVVQINPEMLSDRTAPDYQFQYIDISAVAEPGLIAETRALSFGEAPSRARRVVRAGDVLVSTVRPYLRAFARVQSAPANLVCSTGFAVLRARSGIDGEFIYQWVLTERFVDFLTARTVGSNYPAAGPSDVAEFRIPQPPAEEQGTIGRVLAAMDERVEAERQAVQRLRETKSALMHALLTGQVRVRVEASHPTRR